MSNRPSPILMVAVGLFLFVAVNLFAGVALRFWRTDMTEQGLYTLSEGTRNIVSRIDEPITVRLFYSEGSAEDIPQINSYARRVRELLEEIQAAADGKIVLQVIDPEPYSEAEELANSYGIRGQLVNSAGDMLFFGMAASNSVGEVETVPSFDPRGESFLEYEVAKMINDLIQAQDERGKVAVISSLSLDGSAAPMPGMQAQPPWAIIGVLRDSFEVEILDAGGLNSPIDYDVDVLVVLHPKNLSQPAQYAIDQFALRGGKVLAMVDAYSYFDMPPPGQQNQFGFDRTSNLDTLLGAWGVSLEPSMVVGDPALARPVRYRNSVLQFPLWVELNSALDPELFNSEDIVTAELSLVNLFCPGALSIKEDAATTVTPLLYTTPTGQTIDSVNLSFAPDVIQLAPTLGAQFDASADDERQLLAVRISGEIETAFPDGPPEGWTGVLDPITSSEAPFNALVIADADLVHEALWRSAQMTQLGMMERRNNNPVLVVNAIENLLGSNDLLSLRGRGVFRRPFEKKDELEQAARERFLAKDQELQAKEQELAAEIGKLQQGADEEGVVRMSVQEFEELRAKQEEQFETRKERGRVKHELSKDIETLGNRLKLINIGLIPLLVALGGLAFHMSQRKRTS